MDNIKLMLCSDKYGDRELNLMTESNYTDVSEEKEPVYSDQIYSFSLPATVDLPAEIRINDEIYGIEVTENNADTVTFRLKDGSKKFSKPFLHSYGAVRIELELNEQLFISEIINVLMSDQKIDERVQTMKQYIDDHYEHYLYETPHSSSGSESSTKGSRFVSLKTRIELLEEILMSYKHAYAYLKRNPYAKIQKKEAIGSFGKLQSISPRTIRYIVSHADDLVPVNNETGIRDNKTYYQPNKTLIEQNVYSCDVYENQVVVGFLQTLVTETTKIITALEKQYAPRTAQVSKDGYIDSMYQLFSTSMKKIEGYVHTLKALREEYRQLYFYYVRLLGIQGQALTHIPRFTPVFRSVSVYRQIYQMICRWFSCAEYDLQQKDPIIGCTSASKIYEYYCLLKLLSYLDRHSGMQFIESRKAVYEVNSKYYTDTEYYNTFVFADEQKKLTLFFQPVIYGNDSAVNGIRLFRNTSSNAKNNTELYRGRIYTPDYLIKTEYPDHAEYIIMDAKFSSPNNIRLHQIQDLVYKYLFSVSPLDSQDVLSGLYILCGRTSGSDAADPVHDLARNIGRSVRGFGEIFIMNGTNPDDQQIPAQIFKDILPV